MASSAFGSFVTGSAGRLLAAITPRFPQEEAGSRWWNQLPQSTKPCTSTSMLMPALHGWKNPRQTRQNLHYQCHQRLQHCLHQSLQHHLHVQVPGLPESSEGSHSIRAQPTYTCRHLTTKEPGGTSTNASICWGAWWIVISTGKSGFNNFLKLQFVLYLSFCATVLVHLGFSSEKM